MPYDCCQATDAAFGERLARRALIDYRRNGPAGQTREILKAIRRSGLKDATLLDIGGGIGAIHHELLEDVVREATHVDASSALLDRARAETARRGNSNRVKFVHADFTDVAAELPLADIVTLDRVVCCYPHFQPLLTSAAGRSRHLLAMTYPRERPYWRAAMYFMNVMQRLRRDPFRVFLHPVLQMDEVLATAGMRRMYTKRLIVWEAALYHRI